jgi:hypothetical protein
MGAVEPSATALLHAIVSAVRWEAGIPPRDLLSIGAERWLVWAASSVSRIGSRDEDRFILLRTYLRFSQHLF